MYHIPWSIAIKWWDWWLFCPHIGGNFYVFPCGKHHCWLQFCIFVLLIYSKSDEYILTMLSHHFWPQTTSFLAELHPPRHCPPSAPGVPLRDGHCDLGETANRVAPGGVRCDKSQEEVLQFGVSAWCWSSTRRFHGKNDKNGEWKPQEFHEG